MGGYTECYAVFTGADSTVASALADVTRKNCKGFLVHISLRRSRVLHFSSCFFFQCHFFLFLDVTEIRTVRYI